MDVFREYKPVRNRIAALARDDAIAVIWAYCQYLQIDSFVFPHDIEVSKKYLALDVPQQWISEWELELLAVCPLPTLLFWRFTGGLYYDLISDPRFANEFGEGFQVYVEDVAARACVDPTFQRL